MQINGRYPATVPSPVKGQPPDRTVSSRNSLSREGRSQPAFGRRSQMNRRAVIRLGAFTALAATRGFVPPASAQSKTMFKASDVHPGGYPTVVAAERIGK